MKEQEYLRTQEIVLEMCREVQHLNLKDFLDMTEQAEVIGSVSDPATLALAKDNLTAIKELMKAFVVVQTRYTMFQIIARKTHMKGMS